MKNTGIKYVHVHTSPCGPNFDEQAPLQIPVLICYAPTKIMDLKNGWVDFDEIDALSSISV